MTIMRASICAATLIALAGSIAQGQLLRTVRLQSGLTRPVFVTAPPGDKNRLFIVEQRGSGGVASQAYIKILNLATNTVNATPFLTVTGLATLSEQGLLGLAFDPNYAQTGRFWIYYTASNFNNVLARYQVSANPNIANPAGTILFSVADPFENHNGGWIAFGPNDGYLYVSMGDGGSGGDPNNAGQTLTTMLGKIHRLDVSGATYSIPPSNPFFGSTAARQEIWAWGLRNAWRNGFDRLTGDLFIADVGQNVWEEINFQPANTTTAINYGWRCYEGNAPFNTAGCAPASTMKFPFHTYQHGAACSITGGYVYRGCAIPGLRGAYFFADYCSNQVWSLKYNGVAVSEFTTRTTELAPGGGLTLNQIVSFGEDDNGEIYICDQGGGELYKIVPRCKANCDGSTGVPVLTANDFSCFLNQFAATNCYADCDGIGGLTPNDFTCYLNLYVAGCS
jgi:glucose/arabinose dehydrogenase